ncbi:hypothetical protein VTO42DRAFT_5221 [Malbranchea cinnamomea]
MATRTSTRVVSMVKNSPCVLCQHRLRPSSNIRHFHQSRVLPFSTSDNATPSNDAGATSEDASGPLLQPPDITNHYTIFPKTFPNGPPPASPFAISVPDLRREFLSLQALVHPDKFPSGPAKERAEALSARINEAYRTLSDPLSRAQYLLAHNHGIDVMAEDGAQKHPQDADTLMQVLEAQEAIEEAEDEATIAELKSENGQRIDRCVAELGQAFDRGDVEQARDECVKLKFWYNIRDCLRDWEPGMKEVKLVH